MTLGPRAAEKGQHSSCEGLVQMAPWLSFLWDQQGYCWEGQSRLLSWPGPEAPLPDAELAPEAHPCRTCPPYHRVLVGQSHTGLLFHLTSWQLRSGTASPCLTQTARGPVKRTPPSLTWRTHFTSPGYIRVKIETLYV